MKGRVSISMGAATGTGLGLMLGFTGASGSAFNVPELSVAGIGMSNALVANPDERGAFAYNAAAMGFHDGSSIALGAAFIGPRFSVTTDRKHDGEGADWLIAPMIYAMAQVHEQWRFGFGVGAPFGLETKWAEGTFPELTGSPGTRNITLAPGVTRPVEIPKGDHPTHSKLEIVSLMPSIAYRVNDSLSLAAGLDYYKARDTRLDSTLKQLAGKGDGWGWNLGFLYADGPWSLGASYHSAATLDIEGTVTVLSDALALDGFGQLAPAVVPAQVDLHLPWRLQIGARYEVNQALAVELDWSRTGWSRFDTLKIKRSTDGALLETNTNKFDDTNAYRIGLSYDVLPQTQLRFGYTYDESGQPDAHFSPRIADSDRHLFSIGAAQELAQGWTIEGGYMYVLFEDRTIASSKDYSLLRGDEINGTAAVNGKYEAHAHLIGVEVRKRF
jgi:long-chain fatty acid transport protein